MPFLEENEPLHQKNIKFLEATEKMQAAAVAGLLVLLFILVINAKSRRAKVLPVIPKHPFLVTWPVHLPRVPYGWHASNASCFFF